MTEVGYKPTPPKSFCRSSPTLRRAVSSPFTPKESSIPVRMAFRMVIASNQILPDLLALIENLNHQELLLSLLLLMAHFRDGCIRSVNE